MCTPGNKFPPVYSIGPLVADAKDRLCMSKSATLDCLSWLDAQPRKSVVFLCFGSKGVLSVAQLKEIAKGLEKSDQRFLWVVKGPVLDDKDELNLDLLLPEGFLERTEKKGLVVKSWAPQAAVLRHESVGGFVTHCRWNSVLEAVAAGVPMLAWPLYAEQHLNSVVLEEEMKLAIAMDLSLSSEDGLVSAEEVERKVRKLMGLPEGEALKQRSLEMKGMALAAWEFGGSSVVDFSKLVGS